ncbi:acyltransferase [soil metagenome]
MQKVADTRLLTLDAMRGLAAIAVILFHLDFIGPFAPSGYLAVDFFFLMSGFVIARAYEDRLSNGLTFTGFFIERMIRLYPVYILGLCIGLLRRVAQIATDHPDRLSISELGISTIFNLLMLPSPATDEIAPINGPSWSLFFELIVNVVWATVLVKASRKILTTYVAFLALLLIAAITETGSAQPGWTWTELHYGFIRSFFGFGFGVLLSKLIQQRRTRPSLISVFAATALCVLLVAGVQPKYRAAYDLISILVCFPIIVIAGITFNPPLQLKEFSRTLGDISYPLYLVHFAPLFTISFLARKYDVSPLLWIPSFIFGVCFLSLYIARSYDVIARKYLSRILLRRKEKSSSSA